MKETGKRSKGHEKRPLSFQSSEQAQQKFAFIRVILQTQNIKNATLKTLNKIPYMVFFLFILQLN